MPKTTDSGVTAEEQAAADMQAAARKLRVELDDDDGRLHILMRFENNRVEYSIQNRPDPTMSGVSDALLMSALLYAGGRFQFKRRKKLDLSERVNAIRGASGSTITYKDLVVIDLANERIISTRPQGLTLPALSIVVQNLAAAAAKSAPSPGPVN